MRIAWFRSTPPDRDDPLDDTAALVGALACTHRIDVIVEADAHDFVWRYARDPWDLCVYELDDTDAHRFVWAYLINYPGLVLLKSPHVHTSWGAALSREGRLEDYLATFNLEDRARRFPALEVPLYVSRLVVVSHTERATELRELYPDAHIRFAQAAVPRVETATAARRVQAALRVAATGDRTEPLERAAERARAAGAVIELIASEPSGRHLQDADVVVSLTWPPFDTPGPALAALAAGKPLVTLESTATADWPAFDPQTWLPRDRIASAAPIAITIDPRDEEHSLMQALRRLASDEALRERVGQSARAWWEAHATPERAAEAWLPLLEEASMLAPPPRSATWPAHLDTDGTELTRAILAEFSVTSDLLPTRSQPRS